MAKVFLIHGAFGHSHRGRGRTGRASRGGSHRGEGGRPLQRKGWLHRIREAPGDGKGRNMNTLQPYEIIDSHNCKTGRSSFYKIYIFLFIANFTMEKICSGFLKEYHRLLRNSGMGKG